MTRHKLFFTGGINMDVLKRMACAGVVPVVVLEDAKDAVPTAKAMVAGGIDVMEITFRTAAAANSIKAVAAEVPHHFFTCASSRYLV